MERLAERIVASVAGMVANAVQVVRISHQVEQQQRLLELADSAEAGGNHELAETIRQQARELSVSSETDVRFEPGRLAAPVSDFPASGEGIAGGAAKSRSRGKAGRRLGEAANALVAELVRVQFSWQILKSHDFTYEKLHRLGEEESPSVVPTTSDALPFFDAAPGGSSAAKEQTR